MNSLIWILVNIDFSRTHFKEPHSRNNFWYKKKSVVSGYCHRIIVKHPFIGSGARSGRLPAVNDVPIDGGLSALIAAGVGYGIKKVRDCRKEKEGKDLLSK